MVMGDAGRGYCPQGPKWGAKHTGELLRSKRCTQGCKVPPRDTSVFALAVFRAKIGWERSPNSSAAAAKEAAATLSAAAPAAFPPHNTKSMQDSS